MEAIFETNPVFPSSPLSGLKTAKIQVRYFQRGDGRSVRVYLGEP
jgi:hypothetical protein